MKRRILSETCKWPWWKALWMSNDGKDNRAHRQSFFKWIKGTSRKIWKFFHLFRSWSLGYNIIVDTAAIQSEEGQWPNGIKVTSFPCQSYIDAVTSSSLKFQHLTQSLQDGAYSVVKRIRNNAQLYVWSERHYSDVPVIQPLPRSLENTPGLNCQY